MTATASRAERFRYLGYELHPAHRVLSCHYSLDDHRFVEQISLPASEPAAWGTAAVDEAARLTFLLAGVSYYKAGAPPVVDLGTIPVRDGERELLRAFFTEGLAEMAYRNGIEIDFELEGGAAAGPAAPYDPPAGRPLIPFGGGIDSIVTAAMVEPVAAQAALFVVSPPGGPVRAIADAAHVTGLPVVHATRRMDPDILRSTELGFLNGHVPVTGIISAIAVLAAVVERRDAVIMSNESSASEATLVVEGKAVNHQYSKGAGFEHGFRQTLAGALDVTVEYFSMLRSVSTLWIAARFARLERFHPVFRSCNRAFAVDPRRRLDTWCGRCDKCCFTNLVLAPFLAPPELARMFGGREPLSDEANLETFRTLLDLSGRPKPFECVGDVEECRVAAVVAFDRPDRGEAAPVLLALLVELGGDRIAEARAAADRLQRPLGTPDNVPDAYAPADLLV